MSILALLPARYAKAIAAAIGQALTVAQLVYGHNNYVAIALAVAAALGVYAVPNAAAPADVPRVPRGVIDPERQNASGALER